MALTDIDALDRMRGAVRAFDRGRHCRKCPLGTVNLALPIDGRRDGLSEARRYA
jgi:hypothetical protein